MKDFDSALLEGGRLLDTGKRNLLANMGRAVAFLTLCAAAVITFTDVIFSDPRAAQTGCQIFLYLLGATVMFLAMEREGEARGEEEDGFREAKRTLDIWRGRITGQMLGHLHTFCEEYAAAENAHRIRLALLRGARREEDYRAWLGGAKVPFADRCFFRRIRRLKPYPLTAATLLSCGRSQKHRELSDPAVSHGWHLVGKLLPSLICMAVTVSVAVRLKDGMTAQVIAEGILRLSALLSVGIKGYLQGYAYVRDSLTGWLTTKAKLLEAFLGEKASEDTAV